MKRLFWIIRWVLNPVTSVMLKDRQGRSAKEKRKGAVTMERVWSNGTTSQGMLGAWSYKSKERSISSSPWGKHGFGAYGFQTEIIISVISRKEKQ